MKRGEATDRLDATLGVSSEANDGVANFIRARSSRLRHESVRKCRCAL